MKNPNRVGTAVLPRGLIAGLVLMCLGWATAQAQGAGPEREITNVSGDLYRFRNKFHVTVFVVTADGIILADPINLEASTWLKAELAKRFSKPVRYVIYSHSDQDHASGGEVFADTAIFVSHELAVPLLAKAIKPEAMPSKTFGDRMTLESGGKTVVLRYLGRNHTDNSIVMLIPSEKAAFAVDFVNVRRLPFQNLPRFYVHEWVESLKRFNQLDFEILVPGHGPVGTKQDARDHTDYVERLLKEVQAQIDAGKSLEETKAAVTMKEYSSWGNFEAWLPKNIEGAYAELSKK